MDNDKIEPDLKDAVRAMNDKGYELNSIGIFKTRMPYEDKKITKVSMQFIKSEKNGGAKS